AFVCRKYAIVITCYRIESFIFNSDACGKALSIILLEKSRRLTLKRKMLIVCFDQPKSYIGGCESYDISNYNECRFFMPSAFHICVSIAPGNSWEFYYPPAIADIFCARSISFFVMPFTSCVVRAILTFLN